MIASFRIKEQHNVFIELSIKHENGSVLHPDIHYRPRSNLSNTSRSNLQTPRSTQLSFHETLRIIIVLNTRMSVSSDIQTPSIVKSNTGWGASFDIQAPRSKMFKTRIIVSSDIQTPSFIQSNTRRSVSLDIQTPKRYVRSITRMSVSSDIQTPNIIPSNTTWDIKHRVVKYQTRE